MDAKLEIQKPNDIKFTLSLTMTLKEWKELDQQLEAKWPSSQLSASISDMTRQAGKVFYDNTPQPEAKP